MSPAKWAAASRAAAQLLSRTEVREHQALHTCLAGDACGCLDRGVRAIDGGPHAVRPLGLGFRQPVIEPGVGNRPRG